MNVPGTPKPPHTPLSLLVSPNVIRASPLAPVVSPSGSCGPPCLEDLVSEGESGFPLSGSCV